MDIEPLWDLGGWSFLSNCMAEPKTPSTISESFSKSSTLLQFLTLLFILLFLINLSNQPNPSTMASSEPIKSSESTMSTTNLHPHKTQNSHTSTKDAGREFRGEAHEVPSGPNPISNRLEASGPTLSDHPLEEAMEFD
ncbi:CLAVATA3/ESR (CLE)-related protein TDIF-like [Gastrolobium bilobum]|uniref:CLAVATA3/ESR (CLE)-related protein TDIF-like n=1 Tax=Gastrolobium bilobum TaxID=150636 RepID=UPI002AB26354|nr:CLAVATA3/ESR (CLE)-related protein TDIF-like [Gastrolobium bilobum]